MATSTKPQAVKSLLERYPRTFTEEIGVDPFKDKPAELFGVLTFALLASTRISFDLAIAGAKALRDAGWTTVEKMADSTWRQRTDTLNQAGYARYDESTSRYLGDTCEMLVQKYDGDLRRLRETAGLDPDEERELLKACKGIGDVGVDIFFREAQGVWDELFPFADERAIKAARRLKIGNSAQDIASAAGSRKDAVRLVAALVRCELEDAYGEIEG